MSELQPLQIIFYNTFKNREYFEMQHGSRPWHALLLITEGSFSCHIAGQDYIVEAGEIMLFPQNTYYERKVISPISFHQFAFVSNSSDLCAASLQVGKVNLSKEQVFSISNALERAAFGQFHDTNSLYCHTVSYIIMQNYISSDINDVAPPDHDIHWATQYISLHFSEDLNMEALAKKLHLSYTGFLWKFKNTMQCTPSEYLSYLRIHYAKTLLLESNLKIFEIAERCGYNNAFYFTNAFRKHTGYSPSTFRKNTLLSDRFFVK